MSLQVLRRRSPIGAGLEADLTAVRSNSTAPITITHPPEDLETLTNEGDSFIFDSFTTSDAYELGHFLHARLVSDPRPTLISISLANGQTVFQAPTGPGTTPDNESWVARKTASVLRWGCSTWLLHCKYKGNEAVFAAKFGMDRAQAGKYAIHGGAVPIRVKGVEGVVAVVVVSGLKQHEDHGVVVDVIKEHWVAVE